MRVKTVYFAAYSITLSARCWHVAPCHWQCECLRSHFCNVLATYFLFRTPPPGPQYGPDTLSLVHAWVKHMHRKNKLNRLKLSSLDYLIYSALIFILRPRRFTDKVIIIWAKLWHPRREKYLGGMVFNSLITMMCAKEDNKLQVGYGWFPGNDLQWGFFGLRRE